MGGRGNCGFLIKRKKRSRAWIAMASENCADMNAGIVSRKK
jgi:hypothetical protein